MDIIIIIYSYTICMYRLHCGIDDSRIVVRTCMNVCIVIVKYTVHVHCSTTCIDSTVVQLHCWFTYGYGEVPVVLRLDVDVCVGEKE